MKSNRSFVSTSVLFAIAASSLYILKTYIFSTKLLSTEFFWGVLGSLIGAALAYSLIFLKRKKKHIFISYAEKDKYIVDDITTHILKKNNNIFISNFDFKIGDKIDTTIEDKIKNSDGMIVVYSINYNESPWTKIELDYAKKNNIKIFPIITTNKNMPTELSNIYHIKYDNNKDNIDKLIEALD